ncbi:MAG: succinate dehydrogenase, hydrophobic membrane anchor protein [Planctomycetota bacterium]|nr:succinate dehydrogenase, hydrophobic membrane anchor protein [Planctomycetota bacterium]MDI6787166.1 succinate dehydrogenase, hydrophobic membrane anchor protein [Planctomycetota bacterium]
MSFLRWFLQRLTGLVLAVALIIHIVVLHFSGDSPVSCQAVRERLSNPLWFVFYIIFLSATLFHALNGLYEIVQDYKPSRKVNLVLTVGCLVIGLIALIWGIYVLIAWVNWLC